MATKTHNYRGHVIEPCERAKGEHRGPWIIRDYHHTGMLLADELCGHYQTLAAAREAIDIAIRYGLSE